MAEERNIQQLLREGIEAARAGDRAKARELFEQVTELDENNERGWYWLASVVDTDEERRVCLTNVLVINPDNEKARALMNKLDARKREQEADEEVIPGLSRRQLTLVAGIGGGVILILLLVIIAVVIVNTNTRNAEIAAQTRIAVDLTSTQSAFDFQQTATVEARIAAEGTPTPTPLSLPTLPPTFTPTPTEAPAEGMVVLPKPPADVSGRLALWGGRDVLGNGALEIFTMTLGGAFQLSQVGNEYGVDVRFAEGSQRVIYTRWFSPTFSFGIESLNINGTQPLVFQDDQIAFKLSQPDRCPVNNWIAFTAFPIREVSVENIQAGDPPSQIFLVDRETGLRRPVTNDAAVYSSPSFSPDCTSLAAVRNDRNSINAGADIVVIDVSSGSFRPITTDLTTFTETTPRWSPDGSQIIFAAAPATDPNNNDIAVVNANGSGAPLLLARNSANDILPIFSPDGRLIAFSSNRSGSYHIYIYNPASDEMWQVTDAGTLSGNYFVGDWKP